MEYPLFLGMDSFGAPNMVDYSLTSIVISDILPFAVLFGIILVVFFNISSLKLNYLYDLKCTLFTLGFII